MNSAALAGQLDGARLRSLEPAHALQELRSGIQLIPANLEPNSAPGCPKRCTGADRLTCPLPPAEGHLFG
jgi:hypothetical protein